MTPDEALISTATEWGSSYWSEMRRCGLGHHLRYSVGLRARVRDEDPFADFGIFSDDEGPEDPAYFEVGQLVHAVIAYVSAGAMHGAPGLDWGAVLDAAGHEHDLHPKYDSCNIYEADRLMQAYWATWGLDNAGWHHSWKILAVEELITVPAGVWGPLPYTTRADVILELPDGSIVVPDHKTRKASVPGAVTKRLPNGNPGMRARYVRGLQTRPQFLGHAACVQREYNLIKPPAVMLNAIVKTTIPAFERVTIPMSAEAVQRWQQWHGSALQNLCAASVAQIANPEACAPEIGKPCGYLQWCHGSAEERTRYYEVQEPERVRLPLL